MLHGVHPGDPYDALKLLQNHLRFRKPGAGEAIALLRGLGLSNLKPPPPPPQEHLPRWRRAMEGLRHSMGRDAEVIHAPLRRLQPLLRAGARARR